MEPHSPIWTPELKTEASESLHEVLTKNPAGTFDELLENIIRSIAANRDAEMDVDSLTENSSFSEIVEAVMVICVEDQSEGFMGPNYSTFEVYQLANGEFAVLDSNFETQSYSVVAYDESLAAACQTIGEAGLAEFGESGPVIFDPGGEIDPESTTERDIIFWSELFEINSNLTTNTDKQDEDSQ